MTELSEHIPYFLFTDFGADSVYTGQMRGVISSICPSANVMTLTNTVPRQNLVAAAFLLSSSFDYLPPEAHVLCVVDPGVGSDRPIVCFKTSDPERTFLGPDNGMFSVLNDHIDSCRKVTDNTYWMDDVSNTFHGRDVMAPTLAHLANGVPFDSIGPVYDDLKPLDREEWFHTKETDDEVIGTVIYSDVFGNLITSISGEQIRQKAGPDSPLEDLTIISGGNELHGICTSYAERDPGTPLAIISSANQLEIAINQGSAADKLNVSPGDSVQVQL